MQRHCRPNHMFLLLLFFQRQILTGHGHVKVKNNPPKTLGVSLGEMSGEERVRIQLSASSRDNSIISDHIWIFTTFLKINWRMSRYYYPGYKRFFLACGWMLWCRPQADKFSVEGQSNERRSRKTCMKSLWHPRYNTTG